MTKKKKKKNHIAQLAEPLLLWEVSKILVYFVHQQTCQLNGHCGTSSGNGTRETEESWWKFLSLKLQRWQLEK